VFSPKTRSEHAVVDRSGRRPSEAEIVEINARHLIETPLQPADLLFVFGTREDVDERVDEACRLWHQGYFRWAIVSGGVTPGSNRSECEIIRPRWLREVFRPRKSSRNIAR
jgi:hypothetical protein